MILSGKEFKKIIETYYLETYYLKKPQTRFSFTNQIWVSTSIYNTNYIIFPNPLLNKKTWSPNITRSHS